mmetsp:Transcript_11286/g.16682  ORF Transcript_11286/g.16682 Transcript_11286/m.16682 type:complete len:1297 (+) Transcript_11286:44-3934(+)
MNYYKSKRKWIIGCLLFYYFITLFMWQQDLYRTPFEFKRNQIQTYGVLCEDINDINEDWKSMAESTTDITFNMAMGQFITTIFMKPLQLLPRIAIYNFTSNSISIRTVDTETPEIPAISEGTTMQTLRFEQVEDYAGWVQQYIVMDIIVVIPMLLTILIGYFNLGTCIYMCVCNIWGERATRELIQRKLHTLSWAKQHKRRQRKQFFCRIGLCCLYVIYIIFLICWVLSAVIATFGVTTTSYNWIQSTRDMNNKMDEMKTSSVEKMNRYNANVSAIGNQIAPTLIDNLIPESTITTYQQCVDTLASKFPSVSILYNLILNVNGTVTSFPDLLAIQENATLITQQIVVVVDNIKILDNMTLATKTTLEYLPNYLSTIQSELTQFQQEISTFPDVSVLTAIINDLPHYDEAIQANLTASFISTYESLMRFIMYVDPAPNIGVHTSSIYLYQMANLTEHILNSELESMITALIAINTTQANVHSPNKLVETILNFNNETTNLDFQKLVTQSELVNRELLTLKHYFDNLEASIKRLNISVSALPTYDIMYSELAKENDTLDTGLSCIHTMINEIQVLNATMYQFSSKTTEKMAYYANIKEEILKHQLHDAIVPPLETIPNAVSEFIPKVENELRGFNFSHITSNFPNGTSMVNLIAEVSFNFTTSFTQFNVSDFVQAIINLNTSLTNLPDVTPYIASIQTINRTAHYYYYDLYRNPTTGTPDGTGKFDPPPGPYIKNVRLVADIYRAVSSTMADPDGQCTSAGDQCRTKIEDHALTGGPGTGPTQNLLYSLGTELNCGDALYPGFFNFNPNRWCAYRDAMLNRANITTLLNVVSTARSSLNGIPNIDGLSSKTELLNSTILSLTSLSGTLNELSNAINTLVTHNPNFTEFSGYLEDFRQVVVTVNFETINSTLESVQEEYSVLKNLSVIDNDFQVLSDGIRQLDLSTIMATFENLSFQANNRFETFESDRNETYTQPMNSAVPSFISYDYGRIVFSILCIPLMFIVPTISTVLTVTCFSRKPCLLLSSSCCLCLLALICYSFAIVFLPLSMALNDSCPQFETFVSRHVRGFAPLIGSSTLTSDVQFDFSTDNLLVTYSFPAPAPISFDNLYSYYSRCDSESPFIALASDFKQFSGNLSTSLITSYIALLNFSTDIRLQQGLYRTVEPLQQQMANQYALLASELLQDFDCQSLHDLTKNFEKQTCEDVNYSVSFFWFCFFITGVLLSLYSLYHTLSYCCLINVVNFQKQKGFVNDDDFKELLAVHRKEEEEYEAKLQEFQNATISPELIEEEEQVGEEELL